MAELSFKLEVYEGPLDLLLALISKNKVNIYDIPISLILEQYLAYIRQMQELDMEVAGEFIAMAAELMLIKSRMLLPKPEVEKEDPRAQLAQALIEYKKAKEAAVELRERFARYHGRIVKDPEVIETEKILVSHDAELLQKAFDAMVKRSREEIRKLVKPETTLGTLLSETREVVPVSRRILGVMRHLARKGEAGFEEIMLQSRSRSELIASFMALLELLRANRIEIVSDPSEEVSDNAADSHALRFRLNKNKRINHETDESSGS